ncbi:hypothetical protein DLJ53_26690 [Acuticoccus sediminis]|uniref:Flagellar FliJ protein n=1 Tax=Acuticoccus sediminis TaxID=2184697 RepID=A0A8B2NNQ3_9HYPH|nr:hypothetical protein [Acuticoccus sediminis]RAH98299.1 hypothetical protein DLJ53_26690 [Acuticoccus sediminis]
MKRPERLARLARAQRALADLAKAESIAANARYEDSRAQADEILSALNETSVLHGFAVSSMAETLRRNGRTTERLRRVADERAGQHAREDRTAEVLEERAAAASLQARRKAERQSIEILVSSPRRR